MQSDIMYRKVDHIIDLIKDADLDGETMEYIIEQVGMNEQMLRQLVMQAKPEHLQSLMVERAELLTNSKEVFWPAGRGEETISLVIK